MTPPNEPKGFAGLADLASDLDAPSTRRSTPSPAEVPVSTPTSVPTTTPREPTASDSKSQAFEVDESKLRPVTSSTSTFWKWIYGIGGVFIFFVILNAFDSGKTKSTPSYAPSPDLAPSSTSIPSTPAPTVQPPAVAASVEDRPPVGTGLSFSDNQIRYCLAHELRLNGWKEEVNNYSQSAIDRFNNAIADYNSRCSNYRYRRGALERVRAEVEQHHYLLIGEGRALAKRNR